MSSIYIITLHFFLHSSIYPLVFIYPLSSVPSFLPIKIVCFVFLLQLLSKILIKSSNNSVLFYHCFSLCFSLSLSLHLITSLSPSISLSLFLFLILFLLLFPFLLLLLFLLLFLLSLYFCVKSTPISYCVYSSIKMFTLHFSFLQFLSKLPTFFNSTFSPS